MAICMLQSRFCLILIHQESKSWGSAIFWHKGREYRSISDVERYRLWQNTQDQVGSQRPSGKLMHKIVEIHSWTILLQDFITWLNSCRGSSDGVILVSHEPQRKVLGPLLLEALYKYHLLDSFNAVVKGFCNSSSAISALGDSTKITSLSLRSLCKTVLGDTSLPTNSAVDRCTALFSILAKVTGGEGDLVVASMLLPFSSSVTEEELQLSQLKSVLGTQVDHDPFFCCKLINFLRARCDRYLSLN